MHISPIFLKSAGQLVAFGYGTCTAYLVCALIQHAARTAMRPGEKVQVEGRKTNRPTGTAVLDMLRHTPLVHVYLHTGEHRRMLPTIRSDEARPCPSVP